MRRSARRRYPFLALGVAVLLSHGCTVRQSITIDPRGAGTAEVRIELSGILLAYYDDLSAAFTGADGSAQVFDPAAVEAAFAERDGVELVSIEQDDRSSLRLKLEFQDLEAALSQEAETVRFSADGSRRTLEIRLDRATVQQFLDLAPTEGNDAAQFILPPEEPPLAEADYREQLTWALEEYAPADEVDQTLRAATIEVVVTPQGRIVGQTGGEVRGDAVVFELSVLRLLTLDQPLRYSLTFEVD